MSTFQLITMWYICDTDMRPFCYWCDAVIPAHSSGRVLADWTALHRLWTCPGTLSTTATVTGFEKGRARWGRGLPVPRLLPLVYPRGTGGWRWRFAGGISFVACGTTPRGCPDVDKMRVQLGYLSYKDASTAGFVILLFYHPLWPLNAWTCNGVTIVASTICNNLETFPWNVF
jgi:hypothetical protein